MLFVDFAFLDDRASQSDFPILSGNFFLGAYPLAGFVVEHAAAGDLDIRLREKCPFAEYQVYVVVGLGNRKQPEFPGTESKAETEAMLRKAMEDYEAKKFVARADNLTVGDLLDLWVEEDLKPGTLSNGTVMAYHSTAERIKKHPIADRKLKSVTMEHLQAYVDHLCFGGANPDGTTAQPLSKGYLRQFAAVLQRAFKFAVFPKKLLSFNPMEYVVLPWQTKSILVKCDQPPEKPYSAPICRDLPGRKSC